jgi:hypothetical protein
VHVRKRGGVVIDGDANVPAIVFLSGTHVVEVPAITELATNPGVSLVVAFAREYSLRIVYSLAAS